MKCVTYRRIIHGVLKYLFAVVILMFIFFFTWDQPVNYEEKEKKEVELKIHSSRAKPWYFKGGQSRPGNFNSFLKLWPNEEEGDRILNQLMFIPRKKPKLKKKIYVEKLEEFKIVKGSTIFNELNCPIKDCEIVSTAEKADAVLFEDFVTRVREKSTLHQVWILHLLESPLFTGKVIQQTSINWTASYRQNSDIVTPYDKWVYYDENIKVGENYKNHAEGKTKKVAWLVSNCNSNNKRLQYALNLKKYIPVDIYGKCGNLTCLKIFEESCRQMISENYKFYLSFENANCRDYITEKFYLNGLRLDLIPVVMGAPKEDYEKVAPLNSFIHVEDFKSPKHLAEYLNYLDKNDDAYNSYFSWKNTGEFINTYFMCRLCALLHSDRPNHFYDKIKRWWRKAGTCTKTFWNKINKEEIIKSLKNDSTLI